MSGFDLLVRGPDCDVAIIGGKFAEIGKDLSGRAAEEIDATTMLIFPGAIDAHVHFNEPGRTDWEGFETGSRACAAGGTTTVFEMPLNSHPPTTDATSFDAKRAAAEAKCLVDFGLWGGLIPGNLDDLKDLHDRGVVGLKAFMCNSGTADFPHVDMATLREGMHIAADLGMLMAVHAESQEITERLTNAKMSHAATAADYLESRPIDAELDAIEQAIDCARQTGCRLHIVHVSCGRGVQQVTAARAAGVDVTCETCPHYLILTDEDMETIGPMAKCAPPLRSQADQQDLWRRLDDITTIGSDHSPSPPEMKQRNSFFDVWGGISGCQHLLALLVNSAMAREQIGRLTSENVAARFQIADKGGLQPGKDADLTIVDPRHHEVVTSELLHYRHRQTPYLGRKLRGAIVRTILRGQTIYRDGKLQARPIGRLVRPARS